MRRRELTPKKLAEFIAYLSECGNVSESAKMAAIVRQAAYNHRYKNPEFAKAWDEALAIGLQALEDEARRRAYRGVKEDVYYKGDVIGQVKKYSDTLLIFLLKGGMPRKYADFHHVEGGDTPIKIEIVKFTDEDSE